jgi:hypothetical protein
MSTIGANKAKYLWDQTIGYQSVNNSWAASRHAIGGLVITASTTTQPAIIQYLPQGTARAALLNKLSVFLRGNTNKVGGVTGKVSLWYTTDANVPDLTAGTNNSLISTISSTGKPTAFNGNWTEVTRSNLGDAEFTFSTGSFVSNEKHFSGWGPVDAATSTATYMAIVIGFSSILTSENIIIDTVSLSPGDIAAIENPYGFDSILLDCRRFYEQSYSIGVAPGTATVNNEILVTQDATNDSTFVVKSFQIKYLATKYSSSPLVYIYSPSTGTVDRALYSVLDGGAAATRSGGAISTNPGDITISTNWTSSSFYDRALFTPSNTTTQLTISGGTSLAREALLKFHYVVDSRIGLI